MYECTNCMPNGINSVLSHWFYLEIFLPNAWLCLIKYFIFKMIYDSCKLAQSVPTLVYLIITCMDLLYNNYGANFIDRNEL